MTAHRVKFSDRQWRLLACARVRWLSAAARGSSGEAIELAERYADGQATVHQLASARFGGRFQPGHAAWVVCWPAEEDGEQMALRAAVWVDGRAVEMGQGRAAPDFFEEIAGPLGGRPSLVPTWLAYDGGQVVKLARSIYDARSWELMPILGDALEEAGCASRPLLAHCRGERDHVRGCWVLDVILGLR